VKNPTGSEEEYVRRVREETQRYTRELFDENAKLRSFLALASKERQEHELHLVACEGLAGRARELETRVVVLESEKRQTEERLRGVSDELERYLRERSELDRQMQSIEAEGRRYLEQYMNVEQQNANLANLYVASYRLHSTLEREAVLGGIQEIVVNLIGSEELGIFEFDSSRSHLVLVASFGIDQERYARIPAGRGIVGECVRSGDIFIAPNSVPVPAEEGLVTACIPLKVEGTVIGAVVIFRLLSQKSGIEDVDRELFNLLATHAATALYCSSLHANHGAALVGAR
jgi:hypothetical protein